MESDLLKEQLYTSTNQLADVLKWLDLNYIVVIYNNYIYRIFYKNKESIDCLTDKKIILIECKTVPGICDDGEWNYYITNAGFNESNSNELIQRLNSLIEQKSQNIYQFIS